MWYVRSELDRLLAPGCVVIPGTAVLCAVAVQFDDLWKIRAPVGHCEGFDLSLFDTLIEVSVINNVCAYRV